MSRDWTYLLWREKTWGERAQTVLANALAGIIGLAMFAGTLWVLGQMIDHAEQYGVEHDRCLKRATNGYEIKKCR